MDSLIRKYMDGELNEEESGQFLDALEADPGLDHEVRALEEVVELGSGLESVDLSAGFTDKVMQQIRARDSPKIAAIPSRRVGLLPMVASWIMALGLGYFLSQGLLERQGNSMQPDTDGLVTFTETAPGKTTVGGLRIVRLVFSPPQEGITNVQVAGSFNNWDPNKTPMRLENGRWVATLVLSPDSYEYMFVIDNDTWVTDPLALTTRDDGFGSRNAVLDLNI